MTTPRESRKTSAQLGKLFTPKQLAEQLNVPETTLCDWRFRRRGPRWLKVGRLVRYPSALLDQWLAERLQGAA